MPLHLGENRFIANANSGFTMQRRRDYQARLTGGVANCRSQKGLTPSTQNGELCRVSFCALFV